MLAEPEGDEPENNSPAFRFMVLTPRKGVCLLSPPLSDTIATSSLTASSLTSMSVSATALLPGANLGVEPTLSSDRR